MSSKRIVDPNDVLLIPGFLGDRTFFGLLQDELKKHGVRSEVWEGLLESPRGLLQEHARALPDFSIMVGYSLGGRILLHRVLDDSVPPLRLGVVISAHPGLPEEATLDRNSRELSDLKWADKLEDSKIPISEFLKEWNSQSVFEGGSSLLYSSEQLADLDRRRQDWSWVLKQTGLSTQGDLREELRTQVQTQNLLWVCGEKDSKYSELYANLKAARVPGEVWRVSGAGHRVPLDVPRKLAEKIVEQIRSCSATKVQGDTRISKENPISRRSK